MSRRAYDRQKETQFKAIVRSLLDEGQYPLHGELVTRMGRSEKKRRSGLSSAQSLWRREVLVDYGYEPDESATLKRLIKR